jgi:hypothetical protein
MPKEFPFKIGADPEFTVLEGSRVLDASNVMPLVVNTNKFPEGDDGYDVTLAGNIGWDGAGTPGEVRPSPSNDPKILVNNIGKLLKAATENLNIFTFASRSTRIPVGGHIHLEAPDSLDAKITNIITRFIASFYLPLLLADDIAHLKARTSGTGYGKIEDFRIDPRPDGHRTFEYRCPSAEWITTPKTAMATLAYLGTVYAEILKNPKKFAAKYKELGWRTNEQGKAFQEIILTGSHKMMKSHFENIKKAIRTFEYYPEYKKEIEYLFHPNKVLNDKKKIGFDILKGWKLEGKEPARRNILNQKNIDKETEKINLEDFENLIHIQGNSKDANIPLFITEMKKRIIGLGWKMKNKYFLFGVKKGVEEFIVFNKAAEYLKGHNLIKTEADAMKMEETFRKMSGRFTIEERMPTVSKEKTDILKHYIIIGIPYNVRQKKDIRTFIEVIHDIETGKCLASKVELDKTTKVAKNYAGPANVSTLPQELVNETFVQAAERDPGPSMLSQIREHDDGDLLDDFDPDFDPQHDAGDCHEEEEDEDMGPGGTEEEPSFKRTTQVYVHLDEATGEIVRSTINPQPICAE